MANTFTGLKLQGRLGRFGKTEISDIDGFLQLPDGKVISIPWIRMWRDDEYFIINCSFLHTYLKTKIFREYLHLISS